MTYTVRELHDEETWERFLDMHSPGALFQRSAWGDAIRQQGGLVDTYGLYRGKILAGVYMTVVIQARRGPFLHIRHGPILAEQTVQAWQTVLAHSIRLAREKGMWFVRFNPLIRDFDITDRVFRANKVIPAAIHRMDAEQCWILNLQNTQQDILSGMRKSTRYEIRRAHKAGVVVERATDISRFHEFMDLYKKTSERHGFVPHSGIRQEFERFSKSGKAWIYLGRHEGRLVSGAIIIDCGNQAIYHHGASVPYSVPVSHAVQWQAICDAKERGMAIYNFWGVAPEHASRHPWHGISVFKRGFGGTLVTYMHAKDIPVSLWYILPRTIETVRRVFRGYD